MWTLFIFTSILHYYLCNSIIQLPHRFMCELWTPFLFWTTAEVILLFASDGESIAELCDTAAHVRVQNEFGIILNDSWPNPFIYSYVSVYPWNYFFKIILRCKKISCDFFLYWYYTNNDTIQKGSNIRSIKLIEPWNLLLKRINRKYTCFVKKYLVYSLFLQKNIQIDAIVYKYSC